MLQQLTPISSVVRRHTVRSRTGALFPLFVSVFLLVVVLVPASDTMAVADPPSSNAIRLQHRTWVPDPESSLHHRPFRTPRHVLIQAPEGSLDAMVEGIEGRGVNVLEFVPPNTVTAFVRARTDLSDLPTVRWVGTVDPFDKLSWYLEVEENSARLLVDVFPDVSEQRARRLLNRLASSSGPLSETERGVGPQIGDHSYLVSTDIDGLLEILRHDVVEFVSPPPRSRPAGACGGALSPYGPLAVIAAGTPGWGDSRCCPERLGYHFRNGTLDLAGNLEEDEFERALAEWSRVVDVEWFEEAQPEQPRTLDVLWGDGAHGDPFPFDGRGGVLAHAYPPPPSNGEPFAGDVHIDDAETWRAGSVYDYFSTALHEVGHSLGLSHSPEAEAVMYASTDGRAKPGLHCDDIRRIRSLYTPQGPDTDLVLADRTLRDPDDFRARNRIVVGPNLLVSPPPEVEMVAGREVRLLPGFSTAPGAGYHARIDLDVACDCSLAADGCVCEPALRAPSLTTGQLRFEYDLPKPGTVRFRLANVSGQVVRQVQVSRSSCGTFTDSLNTSGLASGVYFLTMTVGSFSQTVQVVKV